MQLELYVVYGKEHPVYTARVIGRYRRKWVAKLHAWLFENTLSLLWPSAWVEVEEELVN